MMKRSHNNGASHALYDLVLDRNWTEVVAHCHSHPVDASYEDSDTFGETPLYLSMNFHPPSYAVKALVEAYPGAVYPQTKNRDCPLHLACRFGASYEVLKILVDSDPITAKSTSKYGVTPLSALRRHFLADYPKGVFSSSFIQSSEGGGAEFWRKVCLILLSSYYGRIFPKVEDQKLLHCAVSASCPVLFEVILFELYPNEAMEPMLEMQNRLPLFVAAEKSLYDECRSSYEIGKLLDIFPQAACCTDRSCNNRYPLHIAIDCKKTWNGGLRLLVDTAPEILLSPDPITRLYPFMMARDNSESCLRLLLAEPEALRIALSGVI